MTLQEKLSERLIRYAKIHTQSDEASDTTPSTPWQWDLAKLLKKELTELGLTDITLDDHAYLFATLPANTDKDVPTIGFMAHIDTATDFTGENVNPKIWQDYNGEDIPLNDDVIMSTSEYPELKDYLGHTLITTDGTTLLGADNKAGIAEIMTAMEYLKNHPEIEHGKIRIAFTPDEEIGRGPHHFDVEAFNAELAYTVDGGPLGELQYESFNAAAAKITIKGNSVHPGTAKGKMVNAGKIATELVSLFPNAEAPEHTEEYQGFYHLISLSGDVENANVSYIIRDFDKNAFNERKDFMLECIAKLQAKYGEDAVQIDMHDQYYNMREKIEPVIEVVKIAESAMKSLDISPIIEPIRGGTDGAQLSYKGLPTPNIFTGGRNFHGKYEFISVNDMEKATQTIVKICELFAQR